MTTSKNKFTFKIILSYLVLVALSILVGFLLFSEFEKLTSEKVKSIEEQKFVETGTLINLVYEADGLSRFALLTEDDSDFEKYMTKTDSLFLKIKEIKSLSSNDFQLKQLDSVKSLLIEKNQNIEQLRILGLTNKKDTSLDEIMNEVQKLEASIGLISVETLFKNPASLSSKERSVWQSYADYLNSSPARDTSMVRSKTVDSMLTASRYIVSEAKKANSRIRESLRQKENELILNDLNISERLREIIASFDVEMAKKNNLEHQKQTASLQRTGHILKFAGIIGAIVILIFSYFILSDFFKAERFKKNLEESKNYAESLLKSREQLISTVSHDLKTPLNTITGYAELFENSTLSEKQKFYLTQINSSSHFISHLVDDLLDFSKLEAGKLPIEHIPFSLENIIREAGTAVKQLYLDKPVVLKTSISETIENRIFESDPLRIRQIINNLVGNAFKFTESGSVEIKVDEIKNNDTISTVQISVIDTGIGISKEKQNLIFNEFTQAEADTAHKFGGSGLGLAISKKLAVLLGGTLEVNSVLGSGSQFTLILLLKNSDRILTPNIFEKPVLFNGLKGIVIDDDEAMRSLLKEIFLQLKIETTIFNGFKSFQNSNLNFDFDFILTDIQMPEVDGFSVLKSLKSGGVAFYKNQPVIAMTGSRDYSREHHLQKGFVEMLPKPFSKQTLISVLGKIFPERKNVSSVKINSKEDDVTAPNQAKIHSDKFDLSLLQSFLNTPEALNEVLTIFDVQTDKDLEQLEQAVAEKNILFIKETAHRMLTMFRQIKAVEVIPILEKMENYDSNFFKNLERNEVEKILIFNIENKNQSELKSDFERLSISIREVLQALRDIFV